MRLTKKTVTALLTGSAMTLISTHASAISSTDLGALSSSPISVNGTSAVKNWADQSIGLGWMHNTRWYTFSVGNPGDVSIKVTDTSAAYTSTSISGSNTITTTYNGNSSHPAFSLFSVGAAGFNGANATSTDNVQPALSPSATNYVAGNASIMGWDQVDLSASKSGAFLINGGATGFVGYTNAGSTFVNGMGDAVDHGSAGSSYGTVNGHDYARLDLANLGAGNYLLGIGNNCFFLSNCGNEATEKLVTATATGAIVSDTFNPANTWGAANFNLTVTAVPVPGAVWLFGSALAGFAGLQRRKLAA